MTRILIVEDSPTQAERLRLILEDEGFEVEAASNAEAALGLYERLSADLVISDIVMPGMSGYNLCREIKRRPEGRDTPVVLLSTLNNPMDIISGLECGADNFITKPYEPDHLVARVKAVLENKRLRASGKMKLGVEIAFLGKTFTITSDKEQILDLLISTFEDIVRTNRDLEESRSELAAAKAEIEKYAQDLESQVQIRTAELAKANMALQAEIASHVATSTSLREANELLGAIITSSPLGIFALDLEGNVTLWNAAAERIFGFTADEALGRRPPFLDETTVHEFEGAFSRLLRGESLPTFEVRRRRKDGSLIDVNISSGAIRDSKGALRGIMLVVIDVTARKVLEQQLLHAQKMEAVGQLTGGIAHDFNNLLTVIIGNLELLEQTLKRNPQARELLEAALRAGLRGAELTQQLLAFARRQPLQPKLTDMNELVGGITKLLERTLGENIEVNLITAPQPALVMADPAQIESALANLAVNASHAMPDGGTLTIEVKHGALDEDYVQLNPEAVTGEYVSLEVTDTGTGIPPDVLERVFEPFFTTKKEGKGTGLGLSQVYGFVKQSGGHIKIYSEVGRGTTVLIYLPAAGGVATKSPHEGEAETYSGGATGETILVVEDNANVRRVLVNQLTQLGYRVLEAENAKSALDVLERGEKVDLLFTDVVMPGDMSGHDLAREAAARWPHLKILLTSGFPGAARSVHGEVPFAAELLTKPYRRGDLSRKLRELLVRNSSQGYQ